MELCDDHHAQICFNGGICPLCALMSREDEIRWLTGQIEGHVLTLMDELEG